MTTLRFTWIVAVTTMLAPVVFGLIVERPSAAVAAPVRATGLVAIADTEELQKAYGLRIVAMPAAPGAALAVGSAGAVASAPSVGSAAMAPVCPEIRAIVTSNLRSETFAIVAWGEASSVLKPGATVRAPFGDVTVKRLRSRSVELVAGDVSLVCNLLVR